MHLKYYKYAFSNIKLVVYVVILYRNDTAPLLQMHDIGQSGLTQHLTCLSYLHI